MDLYLPIFFIKGMLIGFAIAAPVGPIGVLCIQRSFHSGFKMGLFTGLGAVAADGVYGLIAAFGLTAISSLLLAQQFWIRLVGGLFLLLMGSRIFFIRPTLNTPPNSNHSLWRTFTTAFFLTLANPMTILSFIGIFAGFGLGTTLSTDYLEASFLVLAIILGSALWWAVLSSSVAFWLHHRLNLAVRQKINRCAGTMIFGFGAFVLFTL